MRAEDVQRRLVRALRLMPTLIVHDPIFRYAAIGVALCIFLILGRVAQNWVGPGANPMQPGPVIDPSSLMLGQPEQATPNVSPTIAPGRPLDGVRLGPARTDAFGVLSRAQKP